MLRILCMSLSFFCLSSSCSSSDFLDVDVSELEPMATGGYGRSGGQDLGVSDTGKRPILAISIDGGGIRGLLPATFLADFEGHIKKQIGSKIHLAECVDIMAGTSTGGLISVGLNISNESGTSPLCDSKFIADFYQKNGQKLFPKGGLVGGMARKVRSAFMPKYDREVLEGLLDDTFFTSFKTDSSTYDLGESFSSLRIPACDVSSGRLYIFGEDTDSDKRSEYTMRDAVFAAPSAPYFFDGYRANNGVWFIDAGIICNNPSLNIFKSGGGVDALKEKGGGLYLLSLGTGYRNQVNDQEALKSMGVMRLVKNIEGLLSLIMDGTSRNTEEILRSLRCSLGERFHLIQANTEVHSVELDDASEDNLKRLSKRGKDLFTEILKDSGSENNKGLKGFTEHIVSFATDTGEEGLMQKRVTRHRKKGVSALLDLGCIPSVALQHFSGDRFAEINFSKIKKLVLSEVGSGHKDVLDLLGALRNNGVSFPHLEVLDLSRNRLGRLSSKDKRPQELILKDLIISESLRCLLLHSNKIGDGNFFDKTSSGIEQLYFLDLSNNRIGKGGIGFLVRALASFKGGFFLDVLNEGDQRFSKNSMEEALRRERHLSGGEELGKDFLFFSQGDPVDGHFDMTFFENGRNPEKKVVLY